MNWITIRAFISLLRWDTPVNILGSIFVIASLIALSVKWLLPLVGGTAPDLPAVGQ